MVSERAHPSTGRLDRLQPYPFQRLRSLLADATPPVGRRAIPLSIGEPRHPAPAMVGEALRASLDESLGRYPATTGTAALRETIAAWLQWRFSLPSGRPDPAHEVLPAAGTREALFAVTQAFVEPGNRPAVFMPNPFYQIYEGAALLAGGEPVLLDTRAENDFEPDLGAITDAQWARCGLIYLCSPGNPNGRVLSHAFWERLFAIQQRHGFVIAADECYSELYREDAEPPLGLLAACQAAGRTAFEDCLVFHSLSKRSNVPGLRSGFIAGDARLIERFSRYRTYQGCALPEHVQSASIAAWGDEHHVRDNRRAYDRKFALARRILQPVAGYHDPQAGFYIWLPVPGGDDEGFCRGLYQASGVTVLPGRYLSRPSREGDPGAGYVRLALVAEEAICEDALERIGNFIQTYA
ncbi:succinyldiaminopimelate transaminase [Spiribacter pallidus]|uniref:succinyldiaminopimelate transaminase n=1 Tax=Spiribacter pallidus TaxID=1987936 RepID=UPI0034A08874